MPIKVQCMNELIGSAMLPRATHYRHTQPSTKSTGFTLVELMVSIAILAILASIAAPAMQNMIVQSRLTSQTNELIGAVQFARGEAIKRNQSIRLCSTASAGATACGGSWAHWAVLNANNTVLRQGSLPSNLKLSSTFTANTLSFAPTGLNNVTPGSNDTLVLCSSIGNGETTRTIQVRLAGGTAVTKSAGCN